MSVMLASRLGSAVGLPGFSGPDTGVDERHGVAVVSWPGGYGRSAWRDDVSTSRGVCAGLISSYGQARWLRY
jgi:hypothetical protein